MRPKRMFRVLTVAALIGGASLAISGSAPASSAAAPAILAQFTWTGDAADDLFLSHCNWHPGETCSFTDPVPGAGDDAIFPTNGGTAWAVDLVSVTIGSLGVHESINFDGVGAAATLKCTDFVVFLGGASGITVTFTADAIITDDD